VQFGRHEAFVNVDRDTALCFSQPAMLGKRPGIMIDDAVPGRDLLAQDGFDFGRRGFAVKAGGDQDRDPLVRDTGFVQAPEQGREGEPVGGRPGNVAN
jgi:hypothetical protein